MSRATGAAAGGAGAKRRSPAGPATDKAGARGSGVSAETSGAKGKTVPAPKGEDSAAKDTAPKDAGTAAKGADAADAAVKGAEAAAKPADTAADTAAKDAGTAAKAGETPAAEGGTIAEAEGGPVTDTKEPKPYHPPKAYEPPAERSASASASASVSASASASGAAAGSEGAAPAPKGSASRGAAPKGAAKAARGAVKAERPAGPQPGASVPQQRSAPRPAPRTRKARLRVAKADPWSVMKVSFLLSIALGICTIVAAGVLWGVMDAMGVFSAVGGTISDATDSSEGGGFDLQSFLSLPRVLLFTSVIAVINVVLATALATLGAFIYNLSAGFVGGVELTLADDE